MATSRVRAPCGGSYQGEKGLWMTMIDGLPHAIVYTHGTCLDEGAEDAACGAGCFFGFGNELNKQAVSDCYMTHERAQWTAVREGLETILDQTNVRRVQIRTTADFVVKVVKESLASLKQRGWKNRDGKVVANDDLYEQVYDALAKLDHVDGVVLPEDTQDRLHQEAEKLAYKEAKHWQKYFRGYDKMFG